MGSLSFGDQGKREEHGHPVVLGKEESLTFFPPNSPEAAIEILREKHLEDSIIGSLQCAEGLPDIKSIKEQAAQLSYLGKSKRDFYIYVMDPVGVSSGREGEVIAWGRVFNDDTVKVYPIASDYGPQVQSAVYETSPEKQYSAEKALQRESFFSNNKKGVFASLGVVGLAVTLFYAMKGSDIKTPTVAPEVPAHSVSVSQEREFLTRFNKQLNDIQKQMDAGITDFRTQPTDLRYSDILFLQDTLQSKDPKMIAEAATTYKKLVVMSYKTNGTVLTSNTTIPNGMLSDIVFHAPDKLEAAKRLVQDPDAKIAVTKAIVEITQAKEKADIGK